ncbi:hypothetical protein M0P48_00775 [Candidatus Gracilibacteria bacterium]|nr:hypothetical protein [Candidatus Gracilibacteria bacterium]
MKGKLITIYGINNIGKSTHAKLLVERLEKEGKKVFYVKYPIYDLSPTGPFLNDVLRGGSQKIAEDELQLWFVLNRYQYEPKLKKLLEEGYIVVAEDYIGTGIAWGTAKGLDTAWLEDMNKFLLKEDFAVMLEGKRDKKSKEKKHVHETNDVLIEKCQKVLGILAEKYGWKKLQVQKEIKDTAEMLWKVVEGWLGYSSRF